MPGVPMPSARTRPETVTAPAYGAVVRDAEMRAVRTGEDVGTSVGAGTASAASRLTRPAPYCGSKPTAPRSSAVSTRRCRTAAGVSTGCALRSRATDAVTNGAAMDVPDQVAYPVGFSALAGTVERMPTPGATTARWDPVLDQAGRTPATSTAPTAMTPGLAAGHSTGSPTSPSLPAATMTATPLLNAYCTASSMTALRSGPPNERLTTVAPWSAAHASPAAASLSQPLPSAAMTRTGSTCAPAARPAPPTPLPATAAMMPATCVP